MDFKLMAQLQEACPSVKKMFQQVPLIHLFPLHFVKMFFLIFMQFHILGSEPQDVLSLVGLFGLGYQQK